MATQPPPAVPPRPSRSPNTQSPAPTSAPAMPKIPPRPNRNLERSVSPTRGSYAPSPLNEPPNGSGMNRTDYSDMPNRPTSVTIPSLGEEGKEYEDSGIVESPNNNNQTPAETRNVADDLKLHAPRPSLPSSSAKAQVQAVTRTDSRQAVAAGLPSATSPIYDEHERSGRSIHSRTYSRADSSTASSYRRSSSQAVDEHGIPEIGRRVPMYPNAGDVQAPSPGPSLEQRAGRQHNRTRSGREGSLPPGSYGLHGHGVPPGDKFEKAWYEKHPEEYVKEEQGQYGPGVGSPRPDWALSSDDLNKIVRNSAVNGSGLGTSPSVAGTPEEEVGYLAADEYTHRLATPNHELHNDSQPAVESPLRKMSFPVSGAESKRETIEENSDEQDGHHEPGVIHVDEPYHHLHHPDGFAPTPAFEGQSHGQEDDDADNEPILAADEVRPESTFQHPAVSPTFDARERTEHDGTSRRASATQSHSDSRSTSRHGRMPSRHQSLDESEDTHTPLEDVAEYEPLFPEDDTQEKKPIPATERFKQRPEILKHRFPSEDIWEDSPNSAQLSATVNTPDLPKEDASETPEQAASLKTETDRVDPHAVATNDSESDESKEKVSSRPELMKQRFPSRDIWEDAPDSQQLVTTVEPSPDDTKSPVSAKSPEVPAKPSIPPRPPRPQKRPQQPPPVDASTKPIVSPTISPIEKRQPPTITDKPKPQIPIRPAKPASPGFSDNLTKVNSHGSASSTEETKEPPAVSTKPKPPIPGRPGGSRIAALKAGFLSDLNSRLQAGPQEPKPQEKKEEQPPAEKGPLSDARKGRARGPARRRPAVEKPATENVAQKPPTGPEVKITEVWNVWQFNEDGDLVVGSADKAKKAEPIAPDVSLAADNTMAPEIAKNIAGESADPKPAPEKEEPEPEPAPMDKAEVPEPEISKPEPLPEAAPEPTEPEPRQEPEPEQEPEPKPELTAPSEPIDTESTKEVDTLAAAQVEEPSMIASPVEKMQEDAPSQLRSPTEEKMEGATATDPIVQSDVEEPFRAPAPDPKIEGAPPAAQVDETMEKPAPSDEREHQTLM